MITLSSIGVCIEISSSVGRNSDSIFALISIQGNDFPQQITMHNITTRSFIEFPNKVNRTNRNDKNS